MDPICLSEELTDMHPSMNKYRDNI